MEILSGLESLPEPRLRSPIVTWGVFDGVHRGHRRVLSQVLAWARAEGVSSALVTFDRHPEEVLRGRKVPLVTPLGERLRLLGELGLDYCVVLNFTLEFSKTSAEEFIRGIVAGRMKAKGIVLGHDSRFGKDRTGDLDFLTRLGRDVGLEVRHSEPELFEGRPVSSSLIREAVAAGRLEQAAYLLGRPPSVYGTVVRGDRRGSQLGFPTANLELHHAVRPAAGVYAADVPLDGKLYRAVVNIGIRPTFRENGAEAIEAHLLDYGGGDLYGRHLEVRFLARLRDEQKFDGPDSLKRQISADILKARAAAGAIGRQA
ncbi:MAG: bifunctional riboflavin kinase/FAD synthetase [Planctomycetaceae bacterium]|nr:bifunctional riboflavin kinase/FAD synthetase [Planctomycetaceae bacterium]